MCECEYLEAPGRQGGVLQPLLCPFHGFYFNSAACSVDIARLFRTHACRVGQAEIEAPTLTCGQRSAKAKIQLRGPRA